MTRKQRIMVAYIIRATVAIIGLLGFILMLGTCGALEQDLIGFRQFFIQSAIGFAMMCGSIHIIEECF